MAADGHRKMNALQPIALAPKATRHARKTAAGRLGVAVLMIGIVGTVGWIGFLGLAAIRLALLALGLS